MGREALFQGNLGCHRVVIVSHSFFLFLNEVLSDMWEWLRPEGFEATESGDLSKTYSAGKARRALWSRKGVRKRWWIFTSPWALERASEQMKRRSGVLRSSERTEQDGRVDCLRSIWRIHYLCYRDRNVSSTHLKMTASASLVSGKDKIGNKRGSKLANKQRVRCQTVLGHSEKVADYCGGKI